MKFLKECFPWTLDIEWFHSFGIHHLDKNRRVVIAPGDGPVGVYTGLWVTIKNKIEGTRIDSRFFPFILIPKERVDNRQPGSSKYPYLPQNGFEATNDGWYIAIPKSTKNFVQSIEDYVASWK
jgi:hypothetical protein